MEFFRRALPLLIIDRRAYGKRKHSSRKKSNLVNVAGYLLILILVSVHGLLAVERELAVVIVAVANMYSAPTEDIDVVSQAILGSNVEVLAENASWAKVRTNDQYQGWMRTQDTRRLEPSQAGYATSGQIAQVSSLLANVYRETDVTVHQPLLTIPFETRLEVMALGQDDAADWFQVRLPDQRIGWIQAGDVDPAPPKLSIKESIALGRRFLGLTYLWGASDRELAAPEPESRLLEARLRLHPIAVARRGRRNH